MHTGDILHFRVEKDGFCLVIVDWLFGCPLYGFYIVAIDMYEPGDIDGVLMTQPFTIDGPYQSFTEAKEKLQTLV